MSGDILVAMTDASPDRANYSGWDWIAFAVPIALIVLFFLIYLISPSAYLTYILEKHNREKQAVEILTWTSALAGALILFTCAALQWRISAKALGGSILPGGPFFILLVGLASFFFAGEELSWGQTWFHWKTPSQMQGISRETNLHNGVFGHLVRLAGNLFVIGMFIVLPIVWKLRQKLPFKLPEDWRPGIAEWPVGSCILLGLLVAVPKGVFMSTHNAASEAASPFYVNYLEEILEQKEMLFAIAMFIYGLYRIRAIRAQRAASNTGR